MLGVTLSKNQFAPAPWPVSPGTRRSACSSLGPAVGPRLQQLAFESDLLEYDDIFEGSTVIEAKVASLVAGARAEIDRVQGMGVGRSPRFCSAT